MTPRAVFNKIRDHIARDEMPAALNLLRTLLENTPQLNDVLQQSGRLENIRRNMRLGTVSRDEAALEQNRIRFGVLELLSQIERDGSPPATLRELLAVVEKESARIELREEAQAVVNQSAEKIYNFGKIKNANFSIAIKGVYVLSLVGLIAIGFWQKDALKSGLGYDRFFKEKDENFKILILPFKQLCTEGNKSYDAGEVLQRRLVGIAQRENLKISIRYFNDYDFKNWKGEQTARELQEYHYADMLIYGAYQTSDCSAEGDQICLNYLTAQKWNLGKEGTDFSFDNFKKGGFDDLKKGKLQEKIEDIAVFVSLLAQIKSLDHAAYLQKLQNLLADPDFSRNSKLGVYLELSDKLIEEGKLNEPLQQLGKALQMSIELGDKMYQGIFLERIGSIHTTMGNLSKALTFFEDETKLFEELHESYPQNVSFKNGLAISYEKLGETHTTLGNLPKALIFFEQHNALEKELHDAYPQNVEFKGGLGLSNQFLGNTHNALGNLDSALSHYSKMKKIFSELNDIFPQNVDFKEGLGWSNRFLGNAHNDLGNLDSAFTHYSEMKRIFSELHEAYPQNVKFKSGLAISYEELGDTQTDLGNSTQALTSFERFNALETALSDTFPQNVDFKNGLAISYERLGLTHKDLGNLTQALTFFQKFNELMKTLHDAYPQNVAFKNGLASSYVRLAQFTRDQLKDNNKAKNYFQQAEKLWAGLSRDAPEVVQFKRFLEMVRNDLTELD